jgi:SAM-dependent methyltransferase
MIRSIHTPGCGGKEKELFLAADRNRNITDDVFRYMKCDRCGLIRIEEIPDNLSRFYPNDYYEVPTRDRLEAVANADPFKIKVVRRFKETGRLLEIGPAYGIFAFQAKQAGFQVDAIEMDERCCDYLRTVVGVNAIHSASPVEAMGNMESHDVIALWHVIEHLPDPWSLVDAVARNLAPNGVLVLAAPNPDAWQFKVMGKEWPHLDAPRHLYLLPADTLTEYARGLGLERIHYTTTDSDALRWNRFGWQRLLMNRVRGKWLGRIAFLAGYALSLILAPFESKDPKGSAYTLVFRKAVK